MFDPSKYVAKEPKWLPVILVLDVSGSMSGEKINNLYDATVEMIKEFAEEVTREVVIKVGIVTFGEKIKLEESLTNATDLRAKGLKMFYANGMTPLGTALKLVKDMIEDKNQVPSNVFRPAIVLVSDGAPTDDWERVFYDFISTGRTQKCERFAIGVGNDADYNMLTKFASTPNNVLKARDAKDIASQFKMATMSISMRAVSVNPNILITNIKLDDEDSNDDDALI